MNYGPPRNRFGWFAPSSCSWSFFSRAATEPATILAFDGVDRQCIRSPKMARIETALLVADGPLSSRKLVQVATLADVAEVHRLVVQLNTAYSRASSPFFIERVATGYQLLTRPEYALWLGKLHQRQAELKLTPPALETLTILAYRQPMTRADLEALRGVQCTDLLKMLMERGLVRIAGEEDTLGRPFLYETTRKFLELFGLRSLDDLPDAADLRRKPPPAPSSEPAAEPEAA
ncbi:MAG TPA: SMC-Scp complex subunit ScpB [Planctomycetaceae bacterium]|nr:SMC-Scp complex subunit ScpB [Planctomycetaceae bacterium]